VACYTDCAQVRAVGNTAVELLPRVVRLMEITGYASSATGTQNVEEAGCSLLIGVTGHTRLATLNIGDRFTVSLFVVHVPRGTACFTNSVGGVAIVHNEIPTQS